MRWYARAAVALALGSSALVGVGSLPAGATSGLTFFVNAASDGSSVSDCATLSNLDCGIDNAIEAFNADTTQNDADTIVFDVSTPLFVSSGTPIDNTVAGVTLDILGNGTTATDVSGSSLNSVFAVNAGTVTITDLSIEDGYSTGAGGGGLYNAGTVTATNDTFSNDSVTRGSDGGGAVYNTGQLTATDDTFVNDSTTSADGGAMFNYGTVTASDDTFADDTVGGGDGGVLFNYVGALFTSTNDTFVDSSASGGGGAVFNYNGTVTASDDTFADDTAGLGDGIMNYGTTVVGNSIIDNAGCYETVTDGGHNVESDDSCGLGATDVVNNPSIGLAGSLAANGSSGPATLAIGQGSSAYEEVPGPDCTIATDERGEERPGQLGQSACDAGAFELQHAAAIVHASQSIDFAPLGNAVLTQSAPALSATATSGLAVGFASSTPNVCTVTGSAVETLSPGTCTITASQAGDNYYFPAPSVTESFSVVAAPLALPGRPTINASSPFKGRVRISIISPSSGATSYQYSVNDRTWARLKGSGPLTLSGLTRKTISVRVRGANSSGEGPASRPVSIRVRR